MILFKQIELLQRIHKLIELSHTGAPCEFSRRMHISERHLREIIDEMKDLGAPINYSRRNETYYYTEPFEIDISCIFRRLSDKEQKNISGGYYSLLMSMLEICPVMFGRSIYCHDLTFS